MFVNVIILFRKIQLPEPREAMDVVTKAGYLTWLAGLIERLNRTFHPRLPGTYLKNPMDSYMHPVVIQSHLFA